MLHVAGQAWGINLSLSNYSSPNLTPVRSEDLLRAAERFEENPFFFSFEKKLGDLFESRVPDIVGFSVNFMSQALCAFAMAGYVRKRFPGIRIVMGGGLVTSWMQIPWVDNPFGGLIDELVSGPGEAALLSMCGADTDALPHGAVYDYSWFPLRQVPVARPGDALHHGPGMLLAQMPVLPGTVGGRRVSAATGFGDGGGLSISLADQFRPGLIHFLDNALSPKFLKSLIENPPGTPWYGFVRITEHLADMDFVRGLARSGCVMLKLGVESGDQRVLDALEKGMDLSTASKALHTLKAAGIAAYVYLLFGTPAEDIESARADPGIYPGSCGGD